jgi:LPS sulfotransferase NodH
VCATPRSGSTLLCAVLAATGAAGRPEEYFEARLESGIPRRPREYFAAAAGFPLHRVPDVDPPIRHYSDLRGVTDWRDHFDVTLRHGTTPNGVFGAKVMWMHLPDLAAFARSTPETVLEELFPGARHVWVRREDRVRQAISLWKAMQTQTWRATPDGAAEPPRYDRDAINHLIGMLERDDAGWERYWERRGIEPLTLIYERDIAPDPSDAAARVLDHLGLDDVVPPGSVPLERQADDASEWWVAQHATGARA